MLNFILDMLIPTYIFIYTCLFGRWIRRQGKGKQAGIWPVYLIGVATFGLTGYVFWRMAA